MCLNLICFQISIDHPNGNILWEVEFIHMELSGCFKLEVTFESGNWISSLIHLVFKCLPCVKQCARYSNLEWKKITYFNLHPYCIPSFFVKVEFILIYEYIASSWKKIQTKISKYKETLKMMTEFT
jgi:hypothetical protein